MKNDSNNEDKFVYSTGKPDVGYLFQEFQRSLNHGSNTARVIDNDNIRFARWEGQSGDGKKHSDMRPDGDPAFPFEGASDVRVRLVDNTINEIVSILMTTFDRCNIRINGTEINDAGPSAGANVLMNWMVNKIKADLRNEAELAANYTQQYGWSAMHVFWEQEMGTRFQVVRAEEIAALAQMAAQQDPTSPLAGLMEAIADKTKEQYAADLITMYLKDMALKDVLSAVREMRETGVAHIPEQYVAKNMPRIVALKPFDEISFPPETIDLQNARVVFRRTFMTELELRQMAASDNWDKEFIEEAINTAGMLNSFNDPNILPSAALLNYQINRNDNLVEVVYAYARLLDKDGIPGIYQTVFCPIAGTERFAKHELLGYAHGKYPFVVYRRERVRRPIMDCRGVPELAAIDQLEVKAQKDSIRDRTAFVTMPPVMVKKRLGGLNRVAPGVHLPVTSPDDYRFMPPPGGETTTAFNLINMVEMNNALYFGLTHPNVPQVKTQVTQQLLVNNWLSVWSETFSMMFSLTMQYMEPTEVERIAGVKLPQNVSEISSMFDFHVKYDVRDIDATYVIEKLKAITQFVLPLDAGGIIDRNKLVKAAVEAIDPDKAKELIMPAGAASQKVYRDIQSDIGLMMLGMEANYVENDPAAGAKMQYIQDIVGKNPQAQQRLQQDPHFRALVENYIKNLQMSVSQEQNKVIGRTGVTPVGEQAGNQMQGEIDAANEAEPTA
jgi:hypothetical protein